MLITHTNTTTLADELRALADRLDKVPVTLPAGVLLSVDMQATLSTGACRADRYAAVDALASLLDLGAPHGVGGSTYSPGARYDGPCGTRAYTSATEDSDNEWLRQADRLVP